jgi:hypothetical protein
MVSMVPSAVGLALGSYHALYVSQTALLIRDWSTDFIII